MYYSSYMSHTSQADKRAFDPLATPPRVRLANFYPFAPGEVAGPHWSESNLFLPATHGQGEVQVGPRRFALQAGQVLHVPWAAPLCYRAPLQDPFVLIGIHLSYLSWAAPPVARPLHTSRNVDLARSSMQAPPAPQPFADPFVLTPPPDSRLLDLGTEIARAYESGTGDEPWAEREARLRALALAFLVEFRVCLRGRGVGPHSALASAAQARVVREIASFMELHLRMPMRRAELAQRAGMSESALADAFRAVTGSAPIDYLIDLRLAHARRMLRTGRERIGEIAVRSGIPDLFYFSKLFKRRTGCSPLEYRKRRRL